MPDFITLSCPTCGGKLQVTQDIERFACAYCGTEHIVKRGGGIVSLAPVIEGIAGVRKGVDRTASELAIRRLQGEITSIEGKINQIYDSTEFEQTSSIPSIIFIFVGVAFGISIFISMPGSIPAFYFPVPIFIIGLGVFMLYSKNNKKRALKEKRIATTTPLFNLLAHKKEEMKYHTDIVSKIPKN